MSEQLIEVDRLDALVLQAYRDRRVAWEEARDQLLGWLKGHAADLLDESDESRLDVSHHRIKAEDRALDKLRRRVAEGRAKPPRNAGDVERCVRDIVGIKVLCKSPRDQSMMCAALLDADQRGELELVEHKDHVDPPKASGYRAHHIILRVPVSKGQPVLVEVQVKTRLQDAWGELTHEDLYKPGAAMKPGPFHTSVARAMAAMLAAVDNMADDLASDLEGSLAPDASGQSAAGDEAPDAELADSDVEVRVRTTGPRFALAVDDRGRQGLIPAYAVRRLLGIKGRIDVNDHVQVNDVLRARAKENDKGFYFIPTSLVE
ncbi:GTP pyrophosphokinase [Luteipulveratus mongoliensis]|uniref:RelA/SpoT domain-containing protein n=1 Tax=Luteipulveratus mongoliensis TaxID=571913 RepID=A0A0K1JDB4_9MICO|nr:RelA/SpoT domain-containing protein [Luteipulveratus mongoliensis]AKU14694.1 hypothetical protein VV02_00420 [Luteipulveratus mongoliensis]